MNIKKQRKILLTGCTGQVGWELHRSLLPHGEIIAPKRQQLELTKPEFIRKKIREWKPDLIVNSAAYNAVSLAESESNLAITINANVPKILAEEAERLGIPLIHYSTDYVFDGKKKGPYTEEDKTNPLNMYGLSKLKGEKGIQSITDKYLILRTSWVYSNRGKNFLNTMTKLFKENNEVCVVSDQFGAPTWSRMIAETTATIIGKLNFDEDCRWGLYHLTAGGKCSWFNFAQTIKKLVQPDCRVKIIPITSSQYDLNIKRPLNSHLSNKILISTFGIRQAEWMEGLTLCLEK
jgi:dTDP-4-dehydrorhamnose reductase